MPPGRAGRRRPGGAGRLKPGRAGRPETRTATRRAWIGYDAGRARVSAEACSGWASPLSWSRSFNVAGCKPPWLSAACWDWSAHACFGVCNTTWSILYYLVYSLLWSIRQYQLVVDLVYSLLCGRPPRARRLPSPHATNATRTAAAPSAGIPKAGLRAGGQRAGGRLASMRLASVPAIPGGTRCLAPAHQDETATGEGEGEWKGKGEGDETTVARRSIPAARGRLSVSRAAPSAGAAGSVSRVEETATRPCIPAGRRCRRRRRERRNKSRNRPHPITTRVYVQRLLVAAR